MNYKRKKFRWAGKKTLPMKWGRPGMAKTNYRQLSTRKLMEKFRD